MPEDTSFYFEKVAGMGWMVRRCDKGSMFDQALCRCKPLSDLVNESKDLIIECLDGEKFYFFVDFRVILGGINLYRHKRPTNITIHSTLF